jgi:tRNAThr (cytosine32-N3)-methyltransferase
MNDLEERARAAIDSAHAADPERAGGRPAEAVYADQLETWTGRLVDSPTLALRLAARGQHLERWAIPRSQLPEGRSGYLRWRSAVHQRQGQRARELLLGCGAEPDLAERVARLVSKTTAREDPEAQVLEDAACLVFLETELIEFQRQHAHDKVLDILQKTWKKMSPAGRELARTLVLPGEAQELLRAALG